MPVQPLVRYHPTCTEVFTSGGKAAYLTGRWFIRDWVGVHQYYIMVELMYQNDLGQVETDWWNGDTLDYALDKPVQGPIGAQGQLALYRSHQSPKNT